MLSGAFRVPITFELLFRPTHVDAMPAPLGVANSVTQTIFEKASTMITAYVYTSGTVSSLPFLFVYLTLVFGMIL